MDHRGHVVIAGGTGFLGESLARYLTGLGHSVTVISRQRPVGDLWWRDVRWEARAFGAWGREQEGAIALVNLAGRSVDCVKTPEHCDEILRSRVEPTRVLGRALQDVKVVPRVWVQMGTAHRYGDPPEI